MCHKGGKQRYMTHGYKVKICGSTSKSRWYKKASAHSPEGERMEEVDSVRFTSPTKVCSSRMQWETNGSQTENQDNK